MQHCNGFSRVFGRGLLMAGLLLVCGAGLAQEKPTVMPDAQIEANVLKALAGAPELADQAITSTTVYGTVTLTGTVRDAASRDMAEKLVSNAAGVGKVVDELTIGAVAVAGTSTPEGQDSAEEGTNPNLQSDGTMAPAQAPPDQNQNPPESAAPQNAGAPPAGQYPPPPQGQNAPYPQGQNNAPYPQGQGQNAPYPQSSQGSPYGPPYRQPYSRPYGAPPSPYGQQRPYVEQRGGDAVVVPSGTLVRVRINQGMDSKHTEPGTVFDGVVLNDVVAGGSIAIPRGAAVQGKVVDVRKAGDFKGLGGLSLQLTEMTLGGRTYPVVSDAWTQQGADKTGQTVSNTVGLGAMGALIGAVAGGGAGAAVGAGVGSVAGLGISSASGRGEAVVPSEAILTFHLTQPTELTTVSQGELNRLGSGVPVGAAPQMRPRYYPPPPPPPYYYRPGYYY